LPDPIRVGLIGSDIQASKSPALHEEEARAQGLAYRYELIDLTERGVGPEALPDLLAEVESRGFAGVNVTHPCKQLVIPHLHDLSEDARQLGAVNTVVLRDGRRIGHNTDWSGFHDSFSLGLPDARREVVVQLGAGGAGVAVAHAAVKLGTGRLLIRDTDRERAERLARDLDARFGRPVAEAVADLDEAMAQADGVINCTPIGMAAHPGLPLDGRLIEPRHWVADIVYFPLETALLAMARSKGCYVLPGGGMAVGQAVGALRLFAGIEPDTARMAAHFQRLTGQ
jgi:shikimate dehydrogenase